MIGASPEPTAEVDRRTLAAVERRHVLDRAVRVGLRLPVRPTVERLVPTGKGVRHRRRLPRQVDDDRVEIGVLEAEVEATEPAHRQAADTPPLGVGDGAELCRRWPPTTSLVMYVSALPCAGLSTQRLSPVRLFWMSSGMTTMTGWPPWATLRKVAAPPARRQPVGRLARVSVQQVDDGEVLSRVAEVLRRQPDLSVERTELARGVRHADLGHGAVGLRLDLGTAGSAVDGRVGRDAQQVGGVVVVGELRVDVVTDGTDAEHEEQQDEHPAPDLVAPPEKNGDDEAADGDSSDREDRPPPHEGDLGEHVSHANLFHLTPSSRRLGSRYGRKSEQEAIAAEPISAAPTVGEHSDEIRATGIPVGGLRAR